MIGRGVRLLLVQVPLWLAPLPEPPHRVGQCGASCSIPRIHYETGAGTLDQEFIFVI